MAGRYNELVFMGVISWFINKPTSNWGAFLRTPWDLKSHGICEGKAKGNDDGMVALNPATLGISIGN
jgi:hypothetical protein